MKSLDLGRYALSTCVAYVMLSGCSGSQPPIGAPGAMPQSAGRPSTVSSTAQLHPTLGSGKYEILFSFGTNVYGLDGEYPVAPLIYMNGTFYGTTQYGGTGYCGSRITCGVVFSLTPGGVEKVLHNFTGGDGANPVAALAAVNGALYGTTPGGGAYGGGTVFRMSLSGAESLLHSFGRGYDGLYPLAGLIAVNGNLYGTTQQGGTGHCGTVFRIRIKSGSEHVLYDFGAHSRYCSDGDSPIAALLYANGMFYGTTGAGGSHNHGTVFSLAKTGVEHVLYNFGGAPDADGPGAALIAVKGRFYGTTYIGGTYGNHGTVFRISPSGEEKVLHSFGNGTDGVQPQASLTDVNGTLYGTTYEGGGSQYCNYGCGTIYSITTTGAEMTLHHFFTNNLDDGAFPQANLVYANGLLYGTTPYGGISPPSCFNSGNCRWGTVFAIKP